MEQADPRWLDAEQMAAWRAFMNLAQRLPAALEHDLQRRSALSFLEYYVLALLSEADDDRLRISELAARVNSKLPRLSQLIGRLETRGLVRRELDPANGRFTLAILTAEGRETVVEAAPHHVESVRELFVDALDPEDLRALTRAAAEVVARIEGRPQPGRS